MGAEQSQVAEEKLKSRDFRKNEVSFYVNGKEHKVRTDRCDPEIGPNYLLVDYLRNKLGLTGTKYMCREGGCGSCMVTIKSAHPTTGLEDIRSSNSCLIPLFACDGLDITTVEALGNRKTGYSAIQDSLVKFGGTQCGYCTPGFVMNMHSISSANAKFTAEDVEKSFDGNICRCTGYRPIMDAFRALSVNPTDHFECIDIEDINQINQRSKCPLNTKLKLSDSSLEILHAPARNLYLTSENGEQWFKVTALQDLFQIMDRFILAKTSFKLVAGNTGTGVYKNDGPYEGFIDINDVPDLKQSSIDQSGIILGAGNTLTAAMNVFKEASLTPGYPYADEFYKHFQRIACHSVRNRGTLAGNLMLKHQHREFHSDIFLLLECIGASLRIGSSNSLYEHYTLMDFLKTDMTGKLILWIFLPRLSSKKILFRSFKLGKRYQNSRAYVNAAFLFEIEEKNMTISSQPRICYGGVNPDFIHASLTENYLKGKPLNLSTLQGALKYLETEINPDSRPEDANPTYRLGLAQSFFYKVFLQLIGNSAAQRLRSGAYEIDRVAVQGKQDFETDPTKYPINQPIPKIESYYQASGEAQYINDIRPDYNELHGAFVVSTQGNATIASIESAAALSVPGVVAFFTAKDVPGANNYAAFLRNPEEIFAERIVRYASQPIGLLVATTRQVALEARSKVVVRYENVATPVLEIADAVNNLPKNLNLIEETKRHSMAFPCKGIDENKAKIILEEIGKSPRVNINRLQGKDGPLQKIKGEFMTSAQYHFTMETQICICVPEENGMHVYPSTQNMDYVQFAIAVALGIPNHNITVTVKRIGGGFGAKSTRPVMVATACAVAAHILNQPVRVALDLETNMEMIGRRLPYLVKYEVDVDSSGKIQKLESQVYCDSGCIPNESTSLYGMICSQSCYSVEGWKMTPGVVSTNTPTNTFCRAPGSAQGVAIIETIMDHIAYATKRDPLEVRIANFMHKGDPFYGIPGAKLPLPNPLPEMIDQLKTSSELVVRNKIISEFNQSNRWRKRGLSVVPYRYPNYYWDMRFPTFISVFWVDGTVNISHGGIEMGQGLNTKVVQVVAHTLQIPMEKVRVVDTYNVISPSTAISGGSVASELICSSARQACLQLLKKLEPVRSALNNPTWEQLVLAANAQDILLTSQFQEKQNDVKSYDVWGATCTEVEIDVLTGDYKIVRVDLLEDAGQSISPLVDIGQIEGAFVMGLSWWLTEELLFDKTTGALLTNNTWGYKPFLPGDLPEDFRISILRNAPNPFGVLSSKATGEPPLNMSVSVVCAIRHAIDSARRDAGDNSWYQMNGPVTREVIHRLCLVDPKNFSV